MLAGRLQITLSVTRGKSPKLSDKQQKELCRMHKCGDYSVSDLESLFWDPQPPRL
jgi:hypothetical protein